MLADFYLAGAVPVLVAKLETQVIDLKDKNFRWRGGVRIPG
jgi:hypothetical protein